MCAPVIYGTEDPASGRLGGRGTDHWLAGLALFLMGFQTCLLHLKAEGSGGRALSETLQSMTRGGHSHNSGGHLTTEREVTKRAGHGLKLCQQWEVHPWLQDSPGALSTLAQQQQQLQVCKAGTKRFSPAEVCTQLHPRAVCMA